MIGAPEKCADKNWEKVDTIVQKISKKE